MSLKRQAKEKKKNNVNLKKIKISLDNERNKKKSGKTGKKVISNF